MFVLNMLADSEYGNEQDFYCQRLKDLLSLPANQDFTQECHETKGCRIDMVYFSYESCPEPTEETEIPTVPDSPELLLL